MARESLEKRERWHRVRVEIMREGCRSRERAAVVMEQSYTLRKRSRLRFPTWAWWCSLVIQPQGDRSRKVKSSRSSLVKLAWIHLSSSRQN